MALLPSAGLNDPNSPKTSDNPNGLINTALNIVDPKGIRKQISGLFVFKVLVLRKLQISL